MNSINVSFLNFVPLLKNLKFGWLHQCCNKEFTWEKKVIFLTGLLPSTRSIDDKVRVMKDPSQSYEVIFNVLEIIHCSIIHTYVVEHE